MHNLINLNTLTDHLIRPPKFTYSLNDLGPSIFDINNIIHERIDCSVTSENNKKLQVSIWKPKQSKQNQIKIKKQGPALIYLHCNCGSRVQAIQLVNRSLQMGYMFIAYDSRACGHSQGQYISLGYHQIMDLEAIIKYICINYINEPQIVLWGRSMGAVTALNYLSKNKKYIKNIKVAVLDSPFVSLKQVICEIVNKKIGAPKMLVNLFVSYLEPVVEQKAGFKISQFDLRNQVSEVKCPLILMASKSDGLVPFQHLEQIYEAHQGKKSIFYLNQSHTDQRSTQTVSKIFKAINRYFLSEKKNSQLAITCSTISKSNNINNQLESFRSSEFPQQKQQTAKKNNRKKIVLTYPYSAGKKQLRTIDLSIQKNKTQNQPHRNTQRKQKLSLNHCKSSTKVQPTRTTIQLFKTEHKSMKNFIIQNTQNLQKYTEQSVIQQRLLSFDSQNKTKDNKQNILRKKVSQFDQGRNSTKIFNFKTNF